MGSYYVYVYFDPRTEPPTPIYVGRGHGERDKSHLRHSHNKILRGKIKNIRADGLTPLIVRVGEHLSFEEASHLENETVLKYGRISNDTGTLCNFTEGGEGTCGYSHKLETRLLFSLQRKGVKQTEAQNAANRARKASPETRAKISNATKGHRWHTPEQIEIIRETMRTRLISDETREKWSLKRKGVKQTPEHIANVQKAKKAAMDARKAAMSEEEWLEYQHQKYATRRKQ